MLAVRDVVGQEQSGSNWTADHNFGLFFVFFFANVNWWDGRIISLDQGGINIISLIGINDNDFNFVNNLWQWKNDDLRHKFYNRISGFLIERMLKFYIK